MKHSGARLSAITIGLLSVFAFISGVTKLLPSEVIWFFVFVAGIIFLMTLIGELSMAGKADNERVAYIEIDVEELKNKFNKCMLDNISLKDELLKAIQQQGILLYRLEERDKQIKYLEDDRIKILIDSEALRLVNQRLSK